jgi:carbonic anhydrase
MKCLLALATLAQGALRASGQPTAHSFSMHGADWTEAVCISRAAQSPVDFEALKLPVMKKFEYDYPPLSKASPNSTSSFAITQMGHALEVRGDLITHGGVLLDNTRYSLIAVDLHSKSEHTVRGKRFPLEVQLHHKAAGIDRMVVLSFLVDCADPPPDDAPFENFTEAPASSDQDFSPALQPLLMAAPPTDLGAKVASNETFDISKFFAATPTGPPTFWQYDGSQTAPPCSETVSWFVRREPLLASTAQIKVLALALRKMTDGYGNYRTTMPWNERKPVIYEANPGSLEPKEQATATRLRSGPFARTDGELQAVKQAELASDLAAQAVEYTDDVEKRVTAAGDAHLENLQAQRKAAEEQAQRRANKKRADATALKEPVPPPVAKHFMPLVKGLAAEVAKKVLDGVEATATDAAMDATFAVRVEGARQQYAATMATVPPPR